MLDPKDPGTTIVVGVDGSPRSEDAVSFAARLASGTAARLVLVHAYPYAPLDTAFGAASIEEPLRREAASTLARARASLPDDADATTLAVADPTPARALQDVAIRESASLIVLGSSHVGRLGRVAPGSTAERLVHGAPCAVVVVPSGARLHAGTPLDPIGVGFDGSPESHVALRAAVESARTLGTRLRVITVVAADTYGAPALQYGPGYYVDADTLLHRANEHLEAVMRELPDDVDAVPVVRSGAPARELADASSNLALLFIGSRGYGPLRAVLLGGVGGALLRDAACPVLLTPRGAAVDTAAITAAAAALR